MTEILTLAEDPVARAKFAEEIRAQGLTMEELEYLLPEDLFHQPFEPLPSNLDLSGSVFLAKYATGQSLPSKPSSHDGRSTTKTSVNVAPAEYGASRITTANLLRKLGIPPTPPAASAAA